MRCPNCNKTIDGSAKFCPYCGTKIVKQEEEKVNDPKTRAEELHAECVKTINSWASDDDENKEFQKITKLLDECDNENLLRLMAYQTKDEFIYSIPDINNKKYEVVTKVGQAIYWATYHGYMAFLSERKVDEKKIVKKADSYEEVLKNYNKYEPSLDDDMMKVLEFFIDTKMGEIEEFDEDLKNLKHSEYDELKKIVRRAVVTGYVVAASTWE